MSKSYYVKLTPYISPFSAINTASHQMKHADDLLEEVNKLKSSLHFHDAEVIEVENAEPEPWEAA